jgi:hypothetical protein
MMMEDIMMVNGKMIVCMVQENCIITVKDCWLIKENFLPISFTEKEKFLMIKWFIFKVVLIIKILIKLNNIGFLMKDIFNVTQEMVWES